MIEFMRIRKIKKPRKVYTCYLCLKTIRGSHMFTTGKFSGQFSIQYFRVREHIKCHKIAAKMCEDCVVDIDRCERSTAECYANKYFKKEVPDG